MKIAFIGAGRLATNLAPALQKGGAEVVEVWSHTRASAQSLASKLGCVASWGRVETATKSADCYLLAVKDAVLKDVIARLHEGREDALLAHTAGSMPLSLFKDAGHARGAVFYPLQTFSKERQVDFSQVYFFLEATSHEDVESLRTLAERITLAENIHELSSAGRRHLHLAAVFACNFTNHCMALSEEILHSYHLPFKVMLPLVEETVKKLHVLSPHAAQTGPAIRGDKNVMGMQLSMLSDRPDLQQIYTLLSESIQHDRQ